MASRPLYETEFDRENELAVAKAVGARYGWEARKLPSRYALDFALVEGAEVRFWLEVKCRRNARAAYPTYMLSLSKVFALLELQERTSIRSGVAVSWTDCLGVLPLPSPYRVSIGGRTDRGDAQDVEPVALFDVGLFLNWPRR